jgi:hypothetical protein
MSKKQTNEAQEPRLIKVTAWVDVLGNRAEVDFFIESPMVCEGACLKLQRSRDLAVAGWVFESNCKKGFSIEMVSSKNASSH